MAPGAKITPMMQQWLDAKALHPDAVLLFRMGDFYELFDEDAVQCAPILEIALTSRDKDKDGTAMAGFPVHSARAYIQILVENGFKVAVCEQLEDPKQKKGIVKRGVVELITPATLLDEESQNHSNKFLVAINKTGSLWHLAAIELASSVFIVTTSQKRQNIIDEILRLAPKEIVIDQNDNETSELLLDITNNYPRKTAWRLEKRKTKSQKIVDDWRLLGEKDNSACWLLVDYVQTLCGEFPRHIKTAQSYSIDGQLMMDEATRENLDLMPNKKGHHHNLFTILARCKTAMAKRQLAKELQGPATCLKKIAKRLERVGELKKEKRLRENLQHCMSHFHDLHKLTALCAAEKVGPRGLARMRDCLLVMKEIAQLINESQAVAAKTLAVQFPNHDEILEKLKMALRENPPMNIKEGGIFNTGFDAELDELLSLNENSQALLLAIEKREREQTGISSLKIKFTRVFGYYIEVSRSNLDKVPSHYQRKQTIANGERYITQELVELEAKLNSAQEKIAIRELWLFEKLRREIALGAARLIESADLVSELDLIVGFADVASFYSWNEPKVLPKEKRFCSIKQGRHPVAEALLSKNGQLFVPNDMVLDQENCSLALITGPNMAGKSTIMRQVALIQILGQLGSFVPASEATLSITDSIFARVGASDDISSGRSTFMVEMTETSHILNSSTEFSLILLDEIGRGTSTYDGLAIAQAVTEHIHDQTKARTLFATHYHEVTKLEERLPRLKNFHVEVEEKAHEIKFQYTLAPGPALKSFGVQVARLAGLPDRVLERATQILQGLEGQAPIKGADNNLPKSQNIQNLLFAEEKQEHPAIAKLRGLNINHLTPVEALLNLQRLQKSL